VEGALVEQEVELAEEGRTLREELTKEGWSI